MIKVLTVVGTRPEAIKMAPVIAELRGRPTEFCSKVCVTAQHREMLDQVLDIFQIVPDHDLDLMQPNQSLSQLTAKVLNAVDEVVVQEKPDWILVQGDTTTVMATSLVAFYQKVKVGHVEAGLRTWNKLQPFPEEVNRRVTDVLADLFFAPTDQSRQNLLNEGTPDQAIVVTGNTAIDSLQIMANHIYQQPDAYLPIDQYTIDGRRLILVTAHRRENFGEPLENICRALQQIAREYGDEVLIVYPVHYNPNISNVVHEMLGDLPNIVLLKPVDYQSFVALMTRAYLILSDSGGVQEEAPSLHKPLLVLRETTERPEVIVCGAAKLVGTDKNRIVAEVRNLLNDKAAYEKMASAPNPFGDGHASRRIIQSILAYG